MLTKKLIVIGVILNVIYTIINTYLGINFGVGMGFGSLTIIIAYALYRKTGEEISKEEIILFMLLASGASFWFLLGILIFVRAYVPGAYLPTWLIPSTEVLLGDSISLSAWIIPLTVLSFVVLGSMILGLIIGYAVSDVVLKNEKMVFPYARVAAVMIEQFVEKSEKVNLILKWLVLGVIVTAIQYSAGFIGLDLTMFDWTPYLPYGFAFALMLNFAIIAVSYIIPQNVTLTLLAGGLVSYLLIAPITAKMGFFVPASDEMSFYLNYLFGFSLSVGLGVMLLGNPLLFVINFLKKKVSQGKQGSKEEAEELKALGFIEFLKAFKQSITQNKILGVIYVGISLGFMLFVIVADVFSPFGIFYAVGIVLLFLAVNAFIDSYILIRMTGETGMSMGIQRLAFYESSLALSGYRGYLGYLLYPAANPFTASSINYWFKIGDLTGVRAKSRIIIMWILSVLVNIVVSYLFVLLIWYAYKFPSSDFPGVGVIQAFAIVKMFAEGNFQAVINPLVFIASGGIVAILSYFTPIASLGVALAFMLPPSYIIPFGIGGLFRLYTDRKYGKKWFDETGQLLASGFVIGAILSQVIFTLLSLIL